MDELIREMINPVPILPARLDWSSAIGNFLLNFGTLDYFVFVFLKDHLSWEEFDKVKERHFKDRISRIAQYMKDENFPDEEQKAFARLIAKAEPFRELRNHLAHGQMYCRIDPATLKPRVTIAKAKDVDAALLPDAKHVGFSELETALQTLPGLIEEFQCLTAFTPEE